MVCIIGYDQVSGEGEFSPLPLKVPEKLRVCSDRCPRQGKGKR
jgi:hypothetical protein